MLSAMASSYKATDYSSLNYLGYEANGVSPGVCKGLEELVESIDSLRELHIGATEEGLFDLKSLTRSGKSLKTLDCYAFDQTRHYNSSELEHLITACPSLLGMALSLGPLSEVVDNMDSFAPCGLSAFAGMKELLVSLTTSRICFGTNLRHRMCLLDIQHWNVSKSRVAPC